MSEIKELENKRGLLGWLNPSRYNLERWAYTLHRVTGFIVAVYFYMHVFVTGFRAGGEEVWRSIMATVNNPLTHPFELIVWASLFYHGLNGIRLTLAELGYITGKPGRPVYPYRPTSLGKVQRAIFLVLMIVAVVLIILAGIEMFVLPGGGGA